MHKKEKNFLKALKESFLISSDLHIHSVFSDGAVWPTIRVNEASKRWS